MEQTVVNYTIDIAAAGTIFVLQTNNILELSQHINCSESEKEFVSNYVDKFDNLISFSQPWPTDYGMDIWERYMIIGVKK